MNQRTYRVSVTFPESERNILSAMCAADIRAPDDQIRYLLRQEAQRRGLVTNSEETGESLAASPVSSVRTA